MSEPWVALSAVAGLVLSVAAVWRIVARATSNLRDDIRDEIRSEVGALRSDTRKRLAEGIQRLDTRIDRVEVRLTEKVNGVEQRLTESIKGVEQRLTESIKGVDKRQTESMLQLEARVTESINGVDKRLTEVDRRLTGSMEASRTELLAAIRTMSLTREAGQRLPEAV